LTIPSFKLTLGSTEIENDQSISIINVRPENNISSLEFVINDYQSKSYLDLIDVFDNVTLDLKNKNSSYTTVFHGEARALQPQLTINGETLTVFCWGKEYCLHQTHCDESYGAESENPDAVAESPRHFIQKYVNEHVENSFGDAEATGWTLNESDTYVDDIHSGLSITNLTSQYHSNFTMINRLCDIVNAYALTLGTPKPGIHWFVDPTAASPRFYVKEICDDHSTGNWPRYYGGTQALATITQGTDFLNYKFHRQIEQYANNVILSCAFRKPAFDYWTEDADTNGIWTTDGDIAVSDDAALKVVGADSLKLTIDANRLARIYYEPTNNWDFSYIGSQDCIPTIGFYARRTWETPVWVYLHLYTTRDVDYFRMKLYDTAVPADTAWMPARNIWYGISLPIGPYYKNQGGMPKNQWVEEGSPDWTDIDGIQIYFNNLGYAGENYFWIDDLHLSGRIIREARDASDIATYNERQVFLRLDTAIDDSFNTTDNTGTAARLAATELFKRSQFKTTFADRFLSGTMVLPMKEDLLPGQQLHVHAGKKSDGTYRYDLDMRIKELTHHVSKEGYVTHVNLTSDLWNTHAVGIPSAWGILMDHAGALGHAEARDLKASGIDTGIPRLTWDPTV